MRRTVLGILAALFLLAGTACSITTEDPGYVAPPPLPAMEQLEQHQRYGQQQARHRPRGAQ